MGRAKVISWALYDFANTAFSALFVTFFFPKLIKELLGGNEFQIGLAMGLSMFFVGIIVPIIGTYSDITRRKVELIKYFTLACIVCTFAVGFVGLYPALILGGIANFFYHACLVVYNATLTLVSGKKDTGNISGIGVAWGYLGTLVSLVMAVVILYLFDAPLNVQLMFPATALFFLAFSLPLFITIKDMPLKNHTSLGRQIKTSTSDVFKTLKKITQFRGVVPFLLAAFAYSNGITAAVVFLYLYAREKLAITDPQFIVIYMIFAVASAGGSYLAGKLADMIHPKKVLLGAGLIWIVVLIMLMFPSSIPLFGLAGAIGGAAMGSIWAAIRPQMISLVPPARLGQFFGFAELADKFSGIVGPIIFGYLVVAAGYFTALASMIVFFALGAFLLLFVPTHIKRPNSVR